MSLYQNQRPRFFEGQYLGAEDLTAAVAYSSLQQARHALGAHTWGIAMGLQLTEKPVPGASGKVDVYIQPGYAWDGFGRSIVVLAPGKIPEEKFRNYEYDATTDKGGEGRLIAVWLRYDESATQNVRQGFEVCETEDQRSRVQETFRIEVGPHITDIKATSQLPHAGQHAPILLAGKSVDAQEALKQFDPKAPPVYDESVPHQMFPGQDERARWLIPIGYVRWLPVQNQPGYFVARDDKDPNPKNPDKTKDSDAIRRFRRYIGVVAEAIQAADGAIRLRDRTKDPTKSYFTKEPIPTFFSQDKNASFFEEAKPDLVWVEGNLHVEGDTRLAGGRLDFRSAEGKDYDTPLLIRRVGDTGKAPAQIGERSLQVLLGPEAQPDNRFAVGPLKADGTLDEKFVVLSGGNVGIGTNLPSNKLQVNGNTGIRQNRLYLSGGDGWSSLTYNAYHNADNTEWVFPDPTHKVMTLEMDDAYSVPRFEVYSNIAADKSAWKSRFKISGDTGNVIMANNGGNVGIGTGVPAARLEITADWTGEDGALRLSGDKPTIRFAGGAAAANEAWALHLGSHGPGNLEFHRRTGSSTWTNILSLSPGGNVGIGTPTPGERLEVRGHIKLHTDGSLYAAGGLENLHILRGTVQADGTIAAGSGFTVQKIGTGLYEINFNLPNNQPFPSRPSASVTQVFPDLDSFGGGGDTRDNAVIVGISTTRMRVKTGAHNGNPDDRDFTFIVLGPR